MPHSFILSEFSNFCTWETEFLNFYHKISVHCWKSFSCCLNKSICLRVRYRGIAHTIELGECRACIIKYDQNQCLICLSNYHKCNRLYFCGAESKHCEVKQLENHVSSMNFRPFLVTKTLLENSSRLMNATQLIQLRQEFLLLVKYSTFSPHF